MAQDYDKVGALITWLEVLNRGYVKPDVNSGKAGSSNHTGIVVDSKDFRPYIDKINEKLATLLNVDDIDLQSVKDRRERTY
jgi:hypothetical protein